MRRDRSLEFEGLEARELLAKAHAAVAHAVHAAIAAPTPLVINGTLTLNNKAATTLNNPDGSMTRVIPVSGTLGTLGMVRGVWTESDTSLGDYEGPDTIQLRNSQGSFAVVFNNANPGKAHKAGHGAVFYELTQRVIDGTSAYANTTESGTIEMTTNTARTGIVSVTLSSRTT